MLETAIKERAEKEFQEGRQEGRQEGHKEGRQEGRQEGEFRAKWSIALKLLAKGTPPSDVADLTDLTIATMLATVVKERVEKERREGRLEGRREGRREGRQEGRQEGELHVKGSIALKLLAKGTPPSDVADLTELTLEEIQSLTH